MKVNINGIPQELSMYRQWVVWKFEQKDAESKPTKVPYNPYTHNRAASNNPQSWAHLNACVNALEYYDGIGFMLTASDPYAVMDIDAPTSAEDTEKFNRYYGALNSFTEISPSGKGCHIWVKGQISSGINVRPFEIYSEKRFITVTGNVHHNVEISSRQEQLSLIWSELSQNRKMYSLYDGDDEASATDQEIIDRAASARNGTKFLALWHGDFSAYYDSQSEADFALIDMLAFYTQNSEQIMRLFRFSGLGKREKAQRDDYLTLMIRKSFDKLPPKVEIEAISESINTMLEAHKKQEQLTAYERKTQDVPMPYQDVIMPTPDIKRQDDGALVPAPSQVMPTVNHADWAQVSAQTIIDERIEFPSGMVGDIARYIYESSPRPVKEVAITAALGLMAGICGAAYNVSGSGLNLYIILLASTGTGKESLHSGISKLMTLLESTVPSARNFMGASHIASPPALLKALSTKSRCCVSLIGEAGIWLKDLSDPNAPSHTTGLRRILLELYGRSGKGATIQPAIYADTAKNVDPIKQPAFSIVGESTQTKFFEYINGSLIAEGFIPRWLMIEYKGKRPPYNEDHARVMPQSNLMYSLTTLVKYVNEQMESYAVTNVDYADDSVADNARAFNTYCDAQINDAHEEAIADLWTRAYLKAMRVAALLAVGMNAIRPIITREVWEWAKLLVLKDTIAFCRHVSSGFASGDVSNETLEQEKSIRRFLREYMLTTLSDEKMGAYGVTDKMKAHHVIPYSAIQKRMSSRREFRRAGRIGTSPTQVIKATLHELELCGVLSTLTGAQALREYETSAKLYIITGAGQLLNEKFD